MSPVAVFVTYGVPVAISVALVIASGRWVRIGVSARPWPVLRRWPTVRVAMSTCRAARRPGNPGEIDPGLAEHVGDRVVRSQRRDLRLLEAEFDRVGGEHHRPALRDIPGHVGLSEVIVIGVSVLVDLVED